MNFLEFISSIIGHLAWPVTFVGVVYLLRPFINQLPIFIKAAKYKDFEITFRDRVEVISSDADSAGLQVSGDLPEAYKSLLRENKNRLHVVVIEAWSMLERALRAKYSVTDSSGTRREPSITQVIRNLYSHRQITEEEFGLLREFQIARNRAVHLEIPDLDEESVVQFLRISAALKNQIEKPEK